MTVPIKPLLWGPTPNAQLALTLAKQGFGSCNIGGRQLVGFGGNPPPTTAPPGVRAAGLDMYLSVWAVNYWNDKTPFIDWFDAPDQNGHHWVNILAAVSAVAKAAKTLGCVGLALDTEMYASSGGYASWAWNYSGNKSTQLATDAMAQLRGESVGRAIQAGFPGAKVIVYMSGKSMLPGLYLDLLDVWNKSPVDSAGKVVLPFFNGFIAGSAGVPVTFLDSTFYKPNNVVPGPFGRDADHGWARSLAATTTGFAKLALGPNVFVSPFIWLNGDVANEGAWATPTIPATFKQFRLAVLAASQNNLYGIFQYGTPFDYSPFAPVGS